MHVPEGHLKEARLGLQLALLLLLAAVLLICMVARLTAPHNGGDGGFERLDDFLTRLDFLSTRLLEVDFFSLLDFLTRLLNDSQPP